jgi:hypothetical protein
MPSLSTGWRVRVLFLVFLGVLVACKTGNLLVVALLARMPSDHGRTDRSQAAADAVWWESDPHEVDVNGDAVPDIVGLCTDAQHEAPPRVCAADGASFAILWRSEPLVDVGSMDMLRLGVASNKAVVVDALAVLHVYDVRSGKQLQARHRFDQRAERMCRPVEQPGKLWIETESKAGWMFDAASASVTPAPRPRSCLVGRCWTDVFVRIDEPDCKASLTMPGWLAFEYTEEGNDALARLLSHPGGVEGRLAGFKRGDTSPRWMHTIPPVEPLRAQSRTVDSDRVRLAGGRVVAGYDDISGKVHLVALDAKTGDQKWDVITTHRWGFVLTPTRIYEHDRHMFDVRDAATGKLLGSVGASD